MKWYWWLIIIFVPLGVVAYFFYKAGEKADSAAHARGFNPKNNPDIKPKNESDSIALDTVLGPGELKKE